MKIICLLMMIFLFQESFSQVLDKNYNTNHMNWEVSGYNGILQEMRIFIREEDGTTTNGSTPVSYEDVKNDVASGSVQYGLSSHNFYMVQSEASTEVVEDPNVIVTWHTTSELANPIPLKIIGGDLDDREKYSVKWRLLNTEGGTAINKGGYVVQEASKEEYNKTNVKSFETLSSLATAGYDPNKTYEIVVIVYSKAEPTTVPTTTTKPESLVRDNQTFFICLGVIALFIVLFLIDILCFIRWKHGVIWGIYTNTCGKRTKAGASSEQAVYTYKILAAVPEQRV